MPNSREIEMNKPLPRHHTIGLNAMFEAIELPARIANLNPSLSNMDAYNFSHLLPLRECASEITATAIGDGNGDRKVVGKERMRAMSESVRGFKRKL